MQPLELAGLDRDSDSECDHALARLHAPILRFDAREPFLPAAVGYSVFRAGAASPSFPRDLHLGEGVAALIEYAIWWDWDIQHLYELEHVWVAVNSCGAIVNIEASWHGKFHVMRDEAGHPPLQAGRPLLFSEPGKHAFAPSPAWLLQRRAKTTAACGRHAGRMGLHVTPLFAGVIKQRKPLENRLVHTWLERRQFLPSFEFSLEYDLRESAFTPWHKLRDWIPRRVAWWVERLRETIPPGERRILRIAHRGASAHAQENSADALREAARLGADMAEIDIRITADNQPVVAHDSSLKRVYGLDGAVSDYDWASLRAMTEHSGRLLSFDEALVLCKGLGLGMYLDIKQINGAAARSMLRSIRERHYLANVIFGAFRPDVLADIKSALPAAQTSILFSAVKLDPVKLAGSIGADYVHPCWENRAEQPHRLLTPEWIAAVRAANLGIVCWHEERPAEIAALKALDIDAICSDMPELLKSVAPLAS